MTDRYWQQFVHTVSFLEPTKVEGELILRDQDGPKDDPYPVLVLKLRTGYKAKVNVTKTRLLGEFMRARPTIGDWLEIVYHGPAGKAPPGLSPVKEFSVHVTRKGSQPPDGTEKPPRASENVGGPGK
jgi:hypothetical protein